MRENRRRTSRTENCGSPLCVRQINTLESMVYFQDCLRCGHLACRAVSGSNGTASERCIHTNSHRKRTRSQDFSNVETDKRKMLNVLNYNRPEGGKRRRGEFISYQPWAQTNKTLLTYLRCISTESTSKQLLSSYLTGFADHWMPPRLAYARTFPTLTHNQSRRIKYFFITMHLSQNFLSFTFSHPLALQPMQILSNQLTPSFSKLIIQKGPSTPGCQTCLSSPSSPAAGGSDWMPQHMVLFLDKTKDKNVGTRILISISSVSAAWGPG